MPITKVIYSMRVMLQLKERGFEPLATMPNPTRNQFNCWIFERSEDFDNALNEILGGSPNGNS